MEKTGMTKTAGLLIPAVILTAFLAVSSESQDFQSSIPVRKNQKKQQHKMARISIFKAIEIASSRFKGTPVEAELEAEDGYLVYEVELLTGGGNITEVVIDAGNGSILKQERDEEDGDEEDETEDHDGDEGENSLRGQTKISLWDALKAALAARPGTAVEAELDRENGRWLYSVEIVDANDKAFEVKVDAGTGEVRKTKKD